MIMLSRAQMQSMEAHLFDQLRRQIESFLDEHCDFSHPYDGSPPVAGVQREKAVRELVCRARGHGLRSLRGITQFVILGLGYSASFDEIPMVREMLRDPSQTPEHSIQAVLNAVVVAEARRRK